MSSRGKWLDVLIEQQLVKQDRQMVRSLVNLKRMITSQWFWTFLEKIQIIVVKRKTEYMLMLSQKLEVEGC